MRNNPDGLPYLQQALAIAKFESGMYEVVETFLPLTNMTTLNELQRIRFDSNRRINHAAPKEKNILS